MSAKGHKAVRRMWLEEWPMSDRYYNPSLSYERGEPHTLHVAVVPLDKASVEALLEKVKFAIGPQNHSITMLHTTREDKYDLAARVVLEAVLGRLPK